MITDADSNRQGRHCGGGGEEKKLRKAHDRIVSFDKLA